MKLKYKGQMSKSFLKTKGAHRGRAPGSLTEPFISDISVGCQGLNRGRSKLADDR